MKTSKRNPRRELALARYLAATHQESYETIERLTGCAADWAAYVVLSDRAEYCRDRLERSGLALLRELELRS